jgi:hypothetical protein
MSAETDARLSPASDRREVPDRRKRFFHALLVGGLTPRRRAHRRMDQRTPHLLDLHDARWLAVAMLILLMSITDAFLTMELLDRGAHEINPVMDALLRRDSPAFGFVKVSLTAFGVVVLAITARLHAFGRLPVSLILYLVLGLYAGLLCYEYWLLRFVSQGSGVPLD